MMHLRWLLLVCSISELGAVPLLMSWTTSVKYFDELNTGNVTALTPTTTLAIGVDYHYKRGEVYFSNGLGRIYRAWLRPKSYDEKPIVIVEVKLSDGLAVDWVNDNLYWTDVNRKTVEMATLDGLYRRTLFDSKHGVEKPRAIVVNPSKGLLFWSDWGTNARIESSGLDGERKQTIVSKDLAWPNGLALDLIKEKIYILDGLLSTLSSCNYDGSNLKTILKSSDTLLQAFGLTYFADKLYWTSWRSHAIYSKKLPNGNTETVLKRDGLRGILERMMGVKVVHPTLQTMPATRSPCASVGCSHKCLTGRDLLPTCICPYGFTLQPDGKNCIEQGYLLASWRLTIRRYNLDGTAEEPLNDDAKAAIAIDYHYKKGLVFWSDIEEHRIYRAPLEQLNNKTVIATTETCDGLAVDWVHDVLYFTDTEHNTLEAALLDGSKRTVIISEQLEQPRAIALDPFSKLMFWSDWGHTPKIERAVLDGTDRKIIIDTDISWPNGITIDFSQSNKIYWVDGKLSTVESCSYDGNNRETIVGATLLSIQPFAISMIEDHIYWTEWQSQSIFKVKKSTGISGVEKLANSSTLLLRPNGIKVVHSKLQKESTNPCNSMRCKDLCLGSTTPQGAHCMGEEETEIDVDYRSAIGGAADTQPAKLITKIFNDSIQLTLNNSNVIPLAVVTIKCNSRKGCAEDKRCSEFEKQHVFTNKSIFDIPGLLPASLYDVDFQSQTHNEKLTVVTFTNDPPDIPQVTSVEVHGRNVTLKWTEVDTCVPGFHAYHWKIFKTEVKDSTVQEGATNLTEVTIVDLEAEVDYTAHIYTYDAKHHSSISFSTHPDENQKCKEENLLCNGKEDCPDGNDEDINICAGIENVIVYKKSSHEVYFRCKVKSGTIKQLEYFVGSYGLEKSSEMERFKVSAESCIMWPESFCFHISSLKNNKLYNFNISASLKGGKVGQKFPVSAVTREEVSGPPEDMKVVSYNATTVVIQWRHPTQSNGIIKNFMVNIQEVETFEEGACCKSFPIIESPVLGEELFYEFETGGLLPASTYAVSVTVKNVYLGGSKAIDVNTPPGPMEIMRKPKVIVVSLLPLSWKPSETILTDMPQYHSLISSYLLLLIPPKKDSSLDVGSADLGPLQPLLESKIKEEFKVLWHKNIAEAAAFQEAIKVKDLTPRKEYKLAWVQVSQYKDVYSIDYIMSDPFTAL